MINQKGYKLTIIILLIVLSISCLSLLFANIISPSSKGEKTMAACIIDSNFTNEMYDNNSTFEINSAAGFEKMCGMSLTYATKYDTLFQNKIVYLNVDITTTAHIFKFAGTFDGQGHSITISGKASGELAGNGGIAAETSGNIALLCGTLTSSGTIKNVNMKNCSATCDSGGAFNNTYAGIIVGENKGTIENCIVENCEFISNRFKSNCEVGSICGYNNGTIKNCLVKGSYKIGGNDENALLNSDGLYACYFVAEGTEATNSIFTANVTKIKITEECIEPSTCDTAAFNGTNCSSCSSAYANMTSDISTTGGTSGTAWYKYRTLSHGYGKTPYYNNGSTIYYYNVYLRVFIDWTNFSFSSNPTTGGSVSISSLTVPSDYSSVSENTNTLTIYGTTITATAKDGYDFDKWTNSGNLYTANFITKIKLSFANIANTVVDSSSTASVGIIYYLENPSTITFTHDNYSKSNCFSTYTISFTDKTGTSYFIKYTANNMYYISGNTISTSHSSYSMTSDKLNVTVKVEMKSYGITFK